MIASIVVILTVVFILSSIGPLLITDDVSDIVAVERQPCSCDCSE